MLAKAVVARLAAAGVGVEGTTLFWGKLPATPIAAIGVIETAGAPGIMTLDGPATPDMPRCQIVARAPTRQAAHTLAMSAQVALAGFTGGALAGQQIDRFRLMQTPFQLPDEATSYERYAFNVEAYRNGY